MTNIWPSYDHHMTNIWPTGIAGGAGTKADVGLFLWNEQISKRLPLYLYNLETCWRWWAERKFLKRARHSQRQQDIAQGWGFRSSSKRFLNFKFPNHPIDGTPPPSDNLHLWAYQYQPPYLACNFKRKTLRRLWKILSNIALRQLWNNFVTTLGQLLGNFGTKWWLLAHRTSALWSAF